MKILVVDDEIVSRKMMQKIMDPLGECELVESGREAIEAFKKASENLAPFDLMALDIAMPEMDGTEVLNTIREIEREKNIPKEKQIKILMVTGHSDKDTIVTCIQAECDDYIVKPIDREVLIEKIEKIRSGERISVADVEDIQASSRKREPLETKSNIIEEIIFRFKSGEVNLPSAPQISIKFKEMIDKGVNLKELGDLLRQDVAISFKLISVANSVVYRGMVESKTVEQAVNRLGLKTTKQYVEAISNRSLYTTTNKKFVEFIENLWKHSLSCAYASQFVSEGLNLKLSDDAFTLGLLHDIGKLVLLQVFGELEIKGQLGEDINRIEMFDDLDTHHGKFGAALLKRWKFSSPYIQIAMYHDNLEEVDPMLKDLLVVHFANLLVKSMGYDITEQVEIDVEGAESTRLLEIDTTMITEFKDQVKGLMEEMAGIIS